MKYDFDVDIDFCDREKALEVLNCVKAKNKDRVHNTGVYFQDIPYDPTTGIANIDYKEAENLGYFKIDLLSAGVYEGVRDEDHLVKLMNIEPVWELLEYEEFVEKLFHISDYVWLTKKLKPKSVEELAMLLAIIRPAKKHLRDLSWDEIKKDVWTKPEDGSYFFKKSHSISYAVAIVVQMNLLIEVTDGK
jgi:hypothetical protein